MAEQNYIVNSLNMNVKKPRKFWKIIKDMIEDEDIINITSVIFRTSDNHEVKDNHDGPNFLNDYFVNIASQILI